MLGTLLHRTFGAGFDVDEGFGSKHLRREHFLYQTLLLNPYEAAHLQKSLHLSRFFEQPTGFEPATF